LREINSIEGAGPIAIGLNCRPPTGGYESDLLSIKKALFIEDFLCTEGVTFL
jgi:hypothetical protein